GQMNIWIPLNVYAGLTISNPLTVTPGVNNFYVEFDGGANFHGPLNVALGVNFVLGGMPVLGADPRKYDNVYTFATDSQVKIDGDLHLAYSSLVANVSFTVGLLDFIAYRFDPAGKFDIYSNSISGPANIDVTRKMTWHSGRIATTGIVTVKPTAILELVDSYSSTVLDGTTLV